MIVDASARCSGDGFVPRGGPRQAHAREAAGGPISTFSVFWIGASTFSGTMVNGMVWLALTSPLVVGRVSNDLLQARHRCGPSGQQAYSHRRRTSWASRCLTWRGARARDAARGSPRDTRKLDEPLAQDGARAPTRVDFRARCGHCAPLVKLRLRRLLCPEKCTTMAFWPRDVARRPARRAPLWRFGRETSGLCEKEINFLFQKRTDVSRPKRHSGARLAGRLATSRGQNAIVVQNSDIRWENCRFHAGVYAAAT